jgi:hypothetical protein
MVELARGLHKRSAPAEEVDRGMTYREFDP